MNLDEFAVTHPNDIPIDFVKLAQKHKTNEQKMLEALESILLELKNISEMALGGLQPKLDGVPVVSTQPAGADATKQKMFVGKPRGKR